MENEKRENNSKTGVIIILVVTLLAIVVGLSYALWSNTFLGNKVNSIQTGSISFTYTEGQTNVIDITNGLPMTDTAGKQLSGTKGEFDFTVSSTYTGVDKIGYEIYATPITSTLSGDYVKIYLTDGSDNPLTGYQSSTVPTYSSLTDSSISGSKKLYSGELTTSGASQDFKLRAWVADTYTFAEESRTFSFKVHVKATA